MNTIIMKDVTKHRDMRAFINAHRPANERERRAENRGAIWGIMLGITLSVASSLAIKDLAGGHVKTAPAKVQSSSLVNGQRCVAQNTGDYKGSKYQHEMKVQGSAYR